MIISGLYAQDYNFKGMVSGWVTTSKSNDWAVQLGGRYFPGFDFLIPLNGKINIEGELSASLTGSYTSPSVDDNYYSKIKPYRIWAKISGEQFEIRAGLQKINFGSASILRPLMWFDLLDPRDPLQLTDGVYGILGRYYTLNNVNLWVWGLYGNNNRKGWELYETKEKNVEFGGRFQFPVPHAEIGLSYHHRKARELIDNENPPPLFIESDFPENRFGMDIKADLGVGIWVEEVLIHHNTPHHFTYTNMLTLGIDYTFGLGKGLRLMTEHYISQYSNDFFGNETTTHLTAISANYPISIFVSLDYISFYNWKDNNLYNFVNLGLTFDRFTYYIMGFINPAEFTIFDSDAGPKLFSGKGLQVMMVYNY